MADFIQPLELQTWLMSVFAGTPEIFVAIALLIITTMAATFRMNSIGLFFMVGLFLLMFSAFIDSMLIVMIAVIGGLLLGYLIHRIFIV